jgi:hypothetical protein
VTSSHGPERLPRAPAEDLLLQAPLPRLGFRARMSGQMLVV